MRRTLLAGVAVLVLLAGFSSPALADLVYTLGIDLSGTGLGAVNTITTANRTTQEPGQDSGWITGLYETGCMTSEGKGVCPDGFNLNADGATHEIAQNHLVPFSAFEGTVNGGDLVLVHNIAETGQDKSLILENMFMQLISSNGARVFYYLAEAYQGMTLTLGTGQGTGGSAFGFALDAIQAAKATTWTTNNCVGYDCFIGGGFTDRMTNDGNETLFVISTTSPIVVPEPASILGLGTVLLLVGSRLRRKKA